MDYEKAYKEALNWMRSIYPTLTGSDKEDAEHYFPELAESEDERIREELIEFIQWSEDRGMTRHDFHQAKRPAEWIAYLEKQKEPVVDGRGLYYYDGEKFTYCGYPATGENPYDFAMSQQEKQKEQKEEPVEHWQYVGGVNLEEDKEEQKPIEPSDEELQRHQDELYDFKVFAAKQAKEHHISFVHDFEWNNFCTELLSYFNENQKPVDDKAFEEWLDGWFKEHEEDGEIKMTAKEFKNWSRGIRNMYQHKPNIELIQRSWYMEGYHDCEFGYEPKWIIKTGEGGPRYEENPKYGKLIEEKPTEWSKEDKERIQRIHDFMWKNRKGDTDTIYQIEKDADWLESLPERFVLQSKQEYAYSKKYRK